MRIGFAALAFAVMLLCNAPGVAADIRGLIAKVDLEQKQLQIEGLSRRARGQPLVFGLDDKTAIRLAGQPGKLTDLAVGQRVLVDYELRDAQRVARSITIRGVKKEAPPPAGANGKNEATGKKDPNAVAGVLRHVNYTEREIIVVTSDSKVEKQHPFLVPETAKISRDGKPLKFDDLKEGESVVVYSQTRDGKKSATTIDVGATVAKAMSAQPNSTRIERIRRILQLVDALLQMAEEKRDQGQ